MGGGAVFPHPFPLSWHALALVSREERTAEPPAAGPIALRDWGLPGQYKATPRDHAAGEGGNCLLLPPPRLSRCPLTSCQREASGGGTGEVGCIVQRKLDVLAQAPVLEGRVVVGGCSQRKLNCCQLSGGGVNP